MQPFWDVLLPYGGRKRHTLDYDFLAKILLIGDSGVGKSCMLIRFTETEFNPRHMVTIGVDFKIKMVDINGILVKIQVWDTAGQERYRSITQAYYRSASGVLVVFDTTNRASFESVPEWIREIKGYAAEDICVLLVGNKADLKNKEVGEREAKELAKSHGMEYIQTSARTGQNVNAAFIHCVHHILDRQNVKSEEVEQDETYMPPSFSLKAQHAHSLQQDYQSRPDTQQIQQNIRIRRERQLQQRMREEEDDCCGI